MRRNVLTSILAVIAFTLIFGLAYPLAMTGVSQLVFPGKADGSKVTGNGQLVGSCLIGQSFSRPVIGKNGKPVLDEEGEEVLAPDPRYFQPRPSQTGYSANVTYFSNSGPNSVEEREAVREHEEQINDDPNGPTHSIEPRCALPDNPCRARQNGATDGKEHRLPPVDRPVRGS